MTALSPDQLLPDGFDDLLLVLLEQAGEGIDEFSLIKRIAAQRPDSLFAAPGVMRDPFSLFQLHFLLFHRLYRLSDALCASRRQLHIHALRIALEPRTQAAPGLVPNDSLRSYYLDWSQWARTHETDVQRLLDDFWRGQTGEQGEVRAALELFGLKTPVAHGQIKKRYRELVSRHHPDRGGDTERLQAINAALLILERYYRPR